MKYSFLLTSLLAALSMNAFAQSNRSVLKLRLSDRSLISVSLDGRYIDQQTTQLTLDGLRPGLHRVEVYANAGRRPARIYTGTLRLQPETINMGIVDVYERGLRLRTRPMDERDYADRDDAGDSGNNQPETNRSNDGQDDHRNDGHDEVYGDHKAGTGINNPDNTSDASGSFPHGRTGSAADSRNGFSQRDMDDLHSRISARITDTDKEQLMKSALQSRNASTQQIREMLAWLSFDSTRLDFAKWAYGRVSDPRNYWKLEDAFSFDSSKEEFSKSIGGH